MAKKNIVDPMPPVAEEPVEAAPTGQETETQPPTADEDEDLAGAGLTPEQRNARRLARKPSIDHLPPGVRWILGPKDPATGLCSELQVPMFDVDDRIVVERYISWALDQWLDTKVYRVTSIDDETGHVRCIDEEYNHHATVGFKHPGQTFKLAPKKGNPFTAIKVKNTGVERSDPSGQPKKRGRPKGSKNRPKDVIKQERQAKKEGKAA
jgi:hypothetical protein